MAGSGSNIPQQEDSDSDYEREDIRPRGLTGLQNLGNTCYLNSALQSLSNCPPLTQYFLDCEHLIRSEKSPMLSKSYLKLVTELWHKKRPSYVVPSGIVSGIKAVHPMFRGFTQQDAQEFLRCLMDQLHEELKMPVVVSDDSDDDDEEDEDSDVIHAESSDDNGNNANSAADASEQQCTSSPDTANNRRPSCDSTSSQEEDYETCDSGHSSESCSSSGRDVGSGDENGNGSGGEEGVKENVPQEVKRSRKLSALSAGSGTEEYYTPALDMVANTKEMKETANLLEKETETRKGKVFMEGGDSKDQGQGCAVIEAPATASTATTAAATNATAPNAAPSASVPKDGGECLNTETKPIPSSPSSVKPTRKPRKPPNVSYDSIISQTFDGKILSSVRCLNCETVSTTKETFQDLSLPIPSKDHLHMLHSGYPSMTGGGVSPPKGGACGEVNQGWLSSVLTWMKSWFVGPTVTLQDCLAAFFSADELKGDNMYSCGKCKKLRNGLKYSKVLDLPEILSIHLKRFRHEFYSSKISTYISFPLEGLNMEAYADKDCRNEVTTYDLVAIICHHGTAGGGHYTAYCLNHLNGQWYEFDDQYVTEVDVNQVINCEAYVLFYRKSNKKIEPVRQKIYDTETDEQRASILKFYISRPWLSRFQTFAEPGPITNMDFLCKHGGVPPAKVPLLDHLIAEIPQDTWEILYSRFGGGMVCNHLFACKTCQNELLRIKQRQKSEREVFIKLNEEFQDDEYSGPVFAISMAWFRQWEGFARERYDSPPEAIDNTNISVTRNGQPALRQSSDHGHLSKDMWQFLLKNYGGGPELLFRNSTGTVMKTSSNAPPATATILSSSASPSHHHHHQQQQHQQQQNKPTLASIVAAASSNHPTSLPSSSTTSSSLSSSSSSYSASSSSTASSSSSSSSIASPLQSPSSPVSPTTPAPSSSSVQPTTTTPLPTTSPSFKADQSGVPAATKRAADKNTDDDNNTLSVHTSFCNQPQHQQTPSPKPTRAEIQHQQQQSNPNSLESAALRDGKEKSSDEEMENHSNPDDVAQQNHLPLDHPHSSSTLSREPSSEGRPVIGNEKPDDAEKNVDDGDKDKNVTLPSSVKSSISTVGVNAILENEDTVPSTSAISSTSLNKDNGSSKSTLTPGAASSSVLTNGRECSYSERPNRFSQDSGISSEASPISEDQSSTLESDNAMPESSVVADSGRCTTKAADTVENGDEKSLMYKHANGVVGANSPVVVKDPATTVAAKCEGGATSGGGGVVGAKSGKAGGGVGGGSGKGRNRKKKNKNMEVTRI